MTKIITVKPEQAKADQLTIDIVVKLTSGLHRISKLRYGKNELYLIPTTHKKGKPGIDLHTSYHASGEIHGKLTSGKLRQVKFKFGGGKTEPPQIETLGEAITSARDTEILLWKEKRIPLNSIEGVIDVTLDKQGVQYASNIAVVATGYPTIQKSDADYTFEINAQSTPWVDIKYFFVEPSNVDALEGHIKDIIDRWGNVESKLTPLPKSKNLEKAVLFTNLNPWLAIVLFSIQPKC